MGSEALDRFSEPAIVFHDRRLPEPAVPVGYAALIDAFELRVVLPRRLHAIGQRHKVVESSGWRLLTPRHAPERTLAGQLMFALKWEGLDLLVLERLFEAVSVADVEELVRSQPTGRYARRIWFLYEWLTGRTLALPDATAGAYVDVVDAKLQFGGSPLRSPRHRVRNNLPGTRDFCPLVFRTEELGEFVARDLGMRAQEVIAPIRSDILARAAAFLLLEDSRSSFAIEGEQPAGTRIERWGQAIGQAGRVPLDSAELVRLQHILIGDTRFVTPGLRTEAGFIGQRDRTTGAPIPSHISARCEDLPALMGGLLNYLGENSRALDPVIAAACAAFGFVYIHPFEDGNGRLHRYIIHHVLAERGFTPPGMIFPVSAAILRGIEAYRGVLEEHSSSWLPLIDWEPTQDGNVRVLSDTGDFYRFFDATPDVAFLFRCVEATIVEDLPRETAFLESYDRFAGAVQEVVEMPGVTTDLLFRFLVQNDGALSARARSVEFAALSAEEVERVEALFAEAVADAKGIE